MKKQVFLLIAALGVACNGVLNITNDAQKLNGTWVPIKQQFAGQDLPKTVFQSQQLIVKDNTYKVVAESIDQGTIAYKHGKMDIYGTDGVNAGKHFTAVYKFENQNLIICYNLNGDTYPLDFETKSKPMLFLSVFKSLD